MTLTIETLNRGTVQNDGTGDTLYDAAGKINTNFSATKTAVESLQSGKLDASAYVQHFKGVYTSLSALQAAYPTAIAGDYTQVDTGSGTHLVTYAYDVQDGWVLSNASGSGAANTDQLTEGSTNLYFTAQRAIGSVLTGFVAGSGTVSASDTVLSAIQKLAGTVAQGYTDIYSAIGTWTKAQVTTPVALTSTAGAVAIDLSQSNEFYHLLTENTTLSLPTNIVAGQAFNIVIEQDATTARTLSFNAVFKCGTGITVDATLGSITVLACHVAKTNHIKARAIKEA
jgi:hypothetical protein